MGHTAIILKQLIIIAGGGFKNKQQNRLHFQLDRLPVAFSLKFQIPASFRARHLYLSGKDFDVSNVYKQAVFILRKQSASLWINLSKRFDFH